MQKNSSDTYNLLGQIFFLIHLLIDLDLSDIRDNFFHKSWYFRVKNFGAICFLENYLSEQFVPWTSLEATSFLVWYCIVLNSGSTYIYCDAKCCKEKVCLWGAKCSVGTMLHYYQEVFKVIWITDPRRKSVN